MMFIGSKHCQRCGAAAAVPKIEEAKGRHCPRCKVEMESATIGATGVLECERCLGLWLSVASFEKICADREQQATVLGSASVAPTHAVQGSQLNKSMARYLQLASSSTRIDVDQGLFVFSEFRTTSPMIVMIGGLKSGCSINVAAAVLKVQTSTF